MVELSAVARGWAGQRFELAVDGDPAGILRLSTFGWSARLEGPEDAVTMARQGFLGSIHFLQVGDRTIARVERTALLRSIYTVQLGDLHLEMRRIGFGGRTFTLTDPNGHEVGRAVRERGFRLRAALTLEGEWPLPLLAFLLWIPLRVWTAERAASG